MCVYCDFGIIEKYSFNRVLSVGRKSSLYNVDYSGLSVTQIVSD